jgi:class 3 adenylate cyclase
MDSPLGWPLALLTMGVAALVVWGVRERRETTRLRRRLESASEELQRLQHAFARFAPEEVIERVIARGIETGGERKQVTVLFADVVGYTALSESVDPDVLVRIMNGYFEHVSRAVTDHRGHVSTFLGDGVLALFGAFEPNPWQSDDAVHAALAMRRALETYNRELTGDGLPELSLGAGVHRGVGVAGLVGSRDLMEFAVVGRVVNVAARVQDLTRGHDADVIVTAEVHEALDPRFRLRPLPPGEVKGVSKPLEIFAVDGFDS